MLATIEEQTMPATIVNHQEWALDIRNNSPLVAQTARLRASGFTCGPVPLDCREVLVGLDQMTRPLVSFATGIVTCSDVPFPGWSVVAR
jgi:hypothetical protein